MIFVDTSGFFALFVGKDERHRRARDWFDAHVGRTLMTTDYVIDELLTLMCARGESQAAVRAGSLLIDHRLCRLELVQPADFRDAWQIFARYRDKDWSFTDCTSRVVMERLGTTTAFAFDEHFRQFGTVQVVP